MTIWELPDKSERFALKILKVILPTFSNTFVYNNSSEKLVQIKRNYLVGLYIFILNIGLLDGLWCN